MMPYAKFHHGYTIWRIAFLTPACCYTNKKISLPMLPLSIRIVAKCVFWGLFANPRDQPFAYFANWNLLKFRHRLPVNTAGAPLLGGGNFYACNHSSKMHIHLINVHSFILKTRLNTTLFIVLTCIFSSRSAELLVAPAETNPGKQIVLWATRFNIKMVSSYLTSIWATEAIHHYHIRPQLPC